MQICIRCKLEHDQRSHTRARTLGSGTRDVKGNDGDGNVPASFEGPASGSSSAVGQGGARSAAAGGAAPSASAVGAGALEARGRPAAGYFPATALATGSGSGWPERAATSRHVSMRSRSFMPT